MMSDLDMELTVSGGHDITAIGNNATVYGSRPMDLGAAGQRPGLDEPLHLLCQVKTADVTTATSIELGLVTDTDGAGAGAVALISVVYPIASLTVAAGVIHVGTVRQGTAVKRYLTWRGIAVGDPAGGGKLRAWLVKGKLQMPANAGVTLS